MSIQLAIINWLLKTFERPALSKIDEPAIAHQRLLDQSQAFRETGSVTYFQRTLEFAGAEVGGLMAYPKDPVPRAALLYLHGGAYSIGSSETHRKLAGRITAESSLTTFVADYRCAPVAQFPAAYDDAFSCYNALLERGYNKIAIAGDSAGGGLSFALLHGICQTDLPKPFAVVGLSPWTDLTLTSPSLQENDATEVMLPVERIPELVERYIGDRDAGEPKISPVFGSFEGAPETLIQVSQREALFDDALRMADRLREFGVGVHVQTWEHTFHVWQSLHGKIPEATEAVCDVGRFLSSQLTKVTR